MTPTLNAARQAAAVRTAPSRRSSATAPRPARRAPSTAPRRGTERPRLRVVRPRRLHGIATGRVGLIAGLLLFVVLFSLVAFQTVLIGAQARVDEMQGRVQSQEERNRDLAIEIADLRSPERVTVTAKERLDMIEPGSVTFLRSGSDQAVATTP